MTQRLAPKDRKDQILTAAVNLASLNGYQNVTREAIAEAAQCAPASVSHYFGTMTQLRRDIVRAAVRHAILPVIAQALAARDPHVKKASDELKQKALALLAV